MKAPYVIVATKTAAAIIDTRNNNVIKSFAGRTSQRRAREYLEGLRVGWHGRELATVDSERSGDVENLEVRIAND